MKGTLAEAIRKTKVGDIVIWECPGESNMAEKKHLVEFVNKTKEHYFTIPKTGVYLITLQKDDVILSEKIEIKKLSDKKKNRGKKNE